MARARTGAGAGARTWLSNNKVRDQQVFFSTSSVAALCNILHHFGVVEGFFGPQFQHGCLLSSMDNLCVKNYPLEAWPAGVGSGY